MEQNNENKNQVLEETVVEQLEDAVDSLEMEEFDQEDAVLKGLDDGLGATLDGEDTEEESPSDVDESVQERKDGNRQNKKGPVTVVGVRFRTAGKVYYFAPGDRDIRRGTRVVVETARGVELGTSVCDPMEVERRKIKPPLKEVIRIATAEDLAREKANRAKEKDAYRVCFDKIKEHKLDMKLIDAEYTFDDSKILFYFTADGRVDFRDLVKDLAGVFRTRIELRQIGVRDETKILGGYGTCGRPLCCHTYLSDFAPVSIKMAKEQNLSLNPTKISGVCGRLMCCLKNEEDTYEELNKTLPKPGDEVEGSDGLQGEVESVNILRQRVKILVEVNDEKEIHEYPADEITMIRKRRRGEAKRKAKRIENGEEDRVPRNNPEGKGKQERKNQPEKSDENKAPVENKREGERNTEKSAARQEQSQDNDRPQGERRRRRPDRRRGGQGEGQSQDAENRQNAPKERPEGLTKDNGQTGDEERKPHRRGGRHRRGRGSGHGGAQNSQGGNQNAGNTPS